MGLRSHGFWGNIGGQQAVYIHMGIQHLLRIRADRCPPEISEDTVILAEVAYLKESPTSMGLEPAMNYVRRAVWGMLYADDACIVSRSPQGLAKMRWKSS